MVTYNEEIANVLTNIQQVIIGKDDVATLSLVALLARGHVLLEDVPGVGKTMLVRALAKSLACEFKRIEFTPDLLPSDITGISIYNPKELEFEFREGPIFGNIVLADEINRTSPKTQSSLLEGMEEESVTVDGVTRQLEQPFFVMATQNPIDYEGTYPLPEAQLARFILKLKMGYPTVAEQLLTLETRSASDPLHHTQSVMPKAELLETQSAAEQVPIATSIQKYIINIVTMTRDHESVYLGVSPRGSIALMETAKAYAYIQGRDYVIPDDVKYLAPFVLTHRMILTSLAKYDNQPSEQIIMSIVKDTPIPIRKEPQ